MCAEVWGSSQTPSVSDTELPQQAVEAEAQTQAFIKKAQGELEEPHRMGEGGGGMSESYFPDTDLGDG